MNKQTKKLRDSVQLELKALKKAGADLSEQLEAVRIDTLKEWTRFRKSLRRLSRGLTSIVSDITAPLPEVQSAFQNLVAQLAPRRRSAAPRAEPGPYSNRSDADSLDSASAD